MDELLEKYDFIAWDWAWYMAHRTNCFWALRDYYTNALGGVWIGLTEWSAEKGIPLEKYLRVKAKHSGVDQMRLEAHLKRGAQITLKKIDEVRSRFMQEYRRIPDEIELAELTGMTEERILRAMAAKRRQSINDSNDDYDDELLDVMAHQEDTVEQDVAVPELVAEMLKGLRQRDKEIISLRMEGYTDRQVGKKMGISESRICQIRRSIQKIWRLKAA